MNDPGLPRINQEVSAEVYGDVVQLGYVEGDVTILRELPAYRLEPLAPVQEQQPEELTHRNRPGYLLDAAREVVPFRGREQELAGLASWRDSRPRCAVRLISGPGGLGKSRLTAEFARRSQQAGWIALTAVERAATHIAATQLSQPSSGPWPKDRQISVLVIVERNAQNLWIES